MRGDVIEIRARGNVLLIGGAGTLTGLPATLRQRSAGVSAIQHLAGDAHVLQDLRHFWLRRSHARSIAASSDRTLLDLIAAGVAHGDLDVVVLPSHHARGRAVASLAGAPGSPPARVAAANRGAADRATRAAVPPGHGRPPPAAAAALVVARLDPEERLAEVLRRAAARLPRAVGDELLSLVTPESVTAALGLAVFGAAANLTPFGWAADVILAAIAFGFGGLAAVHSLGDLVTCFERMADAASERDLDAAAEALARGASAITVAGLAAILHEKARRWGGGGVEKPVEEPPGIARQRRGRAVEEPVRSPVDTYQRPPMASMSNKEARLWYHQQEERIPSIVDRNAPLATQARQAFEFRNEIRTAARDGMQDRAAANKLMREDPNLTWEQLIAKKGKAGLSGDDIYRSVIESSQRSRTDVDAKLGITRKGQS